MLAPVRVDAVKHPVEPIRAGALERVGAGPCPGVDLERKLLDARLKLVQKLGAAIVVGNERDRCAGQGLS